MKDTTKIITAELLGAFVKKLIDTGISFHHIHILREHPEDMDAKRKSGWDLCPTSISICGSGWMFSNFALREGETADEIFVEWLEESRALGLGISIRPTVNIHWGYDEKRAPNRMGLD